MTPLQIVEARAPEFEGRARMTDLIAEAEMDIGADWGTRRNKAVALLVLHRLSMSERGAAGAPGPITSETEGQVSRTYGWSGIYGDLASTSYGVELLGLRKASFMGFVNRRML